MKLKGIVWMLFLMAVMGIFACAVYAEDGAATAAPAVTAAPADQAATDAAAADEEAAEEEEVELTYQQQASAIIDTVIEDYTVRMAALQAIIDMRDDTIASNADNTKKLNNTIKLLTNVYKDAKKLETLVRPMITALPEDNADKATILATLDKLVTDNTKYEEAQ